MADEAHLRGLLSSGSGGYDYRAVPATAPDYPPPPPLDESTQYNPNYVAPQGTNNSRNTQQSSTPQQQQQQPSQQVIVVQHGPQVSVSSWTKPDTCCGCSGDRRSRWSRRNGLILAVAYIILSIVTVVLLTCGEYSEYSETKDFIEGKCKTLKTFQSEKLFTCDAPNCGDACDKPFPCNVVMGMVHYGANNYSKLLQIYASYTDYDKHLGECSYKPEGYCKAGTDLYFSSVGAQEPREHDEYTCYHSTNGPMRVVLKKNSFRFDNSLKFSIPFIFLGICFLLAIKFCGHKFGCPSQSQIREQKREQQRQQQQIQMQPVSVQAV